MYSFHQKGVETSEKLSERVATYVKSLYSDKPGERQYAIAMLEHERKKYPDEVADLTAKVMPSLFVAANDENEQVSDQANQLITELSKSADPGLEKTIKGTLSKVSTNTQWAAVIGGDPTPEAAKDRVQKAKDLKLSEAFVYKKRNSYRTIIKFSSKQEADSKLSEIQANLNAGAYIVNLDRWCLNPVEREGYFECQNEN